MKKPARLSRKQISVGALFAIVAATALGIYLTRPSSPAPAAASAVYRRGWIFHERREITMVPYPGAGHYVHLVTERWKETVPPYRTRTLSYPAFWTEKRVEIGSNGSDQQAYDPRSNTIYERSGSAVPFSDPAAHNRQMIRSGQWKIAKTTTIDGRKVFRIDDAIATVAYYVDAINYQLVEVDSPGFPLRQPGGKKVRPPCSYRKSPQMPQTTDVDRLLTYEYLPPTKPNEKLLDIRTQHPGARTAPASAAPKQFKIVVNPPQCTPPPLP